MSRLTTLQVEDIKLEILGTSIMHGKFVANAYRATRPNGTTFYGAFKAPRPVTAKSLDMVFNTYESLRKWWNSIQAHNHYYTLPGEEGKGYLPLYEPV